MFRREGLARSDRLNRRVAGCLALIGGYVNATGVVLLGVFSSHMTGNVSRAATDLASGNLTAALAAMGVVLGFFFGALLASVVLESGFCGTTSRSYGAALALEASWLVVFAVLHGGAVSGRFALPHAFALCVAMGVQNSLVTRLSGAVVRTTHLTGVITDLGIEAARWFRWWRDAASRRTGIRLGFGRNPVSRPAFAKVALLGTIAVAFAVGAVGGGLAALAIPRAAMLIPIVAVGACAVYAFVSGIAETEGASAPDSRV